MKIEPAEPSDSPSAATTPPKTSTASWKCFPHPSKTSAASHLPRPKPDLRNRGNPNSALVFLFFLFFLFFLLCGQKRILTTEPDEIDPNRDEKRSYAYAG
jgi:hypothetical protein